MMKPVDMELWSYDVSGSEDPRVHAQVVRLRARFPALLSNDGNHHLCNHHVLRREEHTQHRVHQHSGGVLVHHRHHDHARVSHHTITPHLTLAALHHGPPISWADLGDPGEPRWDRGMSMVQPSSECFRSGACDGFVAVSATSGDQLAIFSPHDTTLRSGYIMMTSFVLLGL